MTATENTPARRSVVQDWVADLPMMQQSVLLTAVRGPDGLPKYHPVKYLLRWYRRCILLSSFEHRVLADPAVDDGGSFLGASISMPTSALLEINPRGWWYSAMNDHVTKYLAALDEVPHHFQLHLLHAAEIVGYKHPDDWVAAWWRSHVYDRLVHDMHLWPETEQQLDARLGDDRAGWLARGDVATNA